VRVISEDSDADGGDGDGCGQRRSFQKDPSSSAFEDGDARLDEGKILNERGQGFVAFPAAGCAGLHDDFVEFENVVEILFIQDAVW